MISCVVEMWGQSREVSGLPEVKIELEEGAGLRDVLAALRRKVPALDGTVIVKGEDRLDDSSTFAVGGQFFQEENTVKLHDGDRVRILTLATGG